MFFLDKNIIFKNGVIKKSTQEVLLLLLDRMHEEVEVKLDLAELSDADVRISYASAIAQSAKRRPGLGRKMRYSTFLQALTLLGAKAGYGADDEDALEGILVNCVLPRARRRAVVDLTAERDAVHGLLERYHHGLRQIWDYYRKPSARGLDGPVGAEMPAPSR